jgi:hypothetical protein
MLVRVGASGARTDHEKQACRKDTCRTTVALQYGSVVTLSFLSLGTCLLWNLAKHSVHPLAHGVHPIR